jgi:hypothetical protein
MSDSSLGKHTRKIAFFPGYTDWKAVLASMIENPDIQSIAVVVQLDDGTCRPFWSDQKLSELAFKEATFRAAVLDELNDREAEPLGDSSG